jgi:hypothetical protein
MDLIRMRLHPRERACDHVRSAVKWPPTEEEATMSFRFTADDMNKLTDAQKDMIIDVVVGGILADGKIEKAEEAMFEQELRKVPWGRSEEVMVEKIKSAVMRVNGLNSPEKAVDFVKTAVATLPDQSVREKTFAMMARMMYSDANMTENEGTVLMVFADQFQIPMETVQKIGTAVKKGE